MKKVKWKSSEEKRRSEQLAREWQQIKAKYGPITAPQKSSKKTTISSSFIPRPPAGRSGTKHIPSATDTAHIGTKKESLTYTGNKVLGITIVHKSCLQPVFSEEEAKDVASMRR